jgi:anti-sigma regulatory factor (Ser/Thr protein kinase)
MDVSRTVASITHLQLVTDSTHVAEARRLAAQLGNKLGFTEESAGNLAIVVTELATNLVAHAGGGTLLFRSRANRPGDQGLEILSLDAGPGMSNVTECLRDGFSTAGTPGNGLGAVRRLSRTFDIYSRPGQGTVLLSEVGPSKPPGYRGELAEESSGVRSLFGVVNVAVKGETECGDSWSIRRGGGRTGVLVIDGLGHGVFAAEAAIAGVKAFEARADRTSRDDVAAINDALRPTRGAAGAVSMIDHAQKSLSFCGVGNISAVIVDDNGERHLVSQNGTLGHDSKSQREFVYPWTPSSLLIMTSDGLGTRWTLASYPGLRPRHPSLIAGVLFRDFCRGRDDATVVVFREGEA